MLSQPPRNRKHIFANYSYPANAATNIHIQTICAPLAVVTALQRANLCPGVVVYRQTVPSRAEVGACPAACVARARNDRLLIILSAVFSGERAKNRFGAVYSEQVGVVVFNVAESVNLLEK